MMIYTRKLADNEETMMMNYIWKLTDDEESFDDEDTADEVKWSTI